MKKNKYNRKYRNPNMEHEENTPTAQPQAATEAEVDATDATPVQGESEPSTEELKAKLAETEAALEKEKKEYLFLMADMDNMRKRNLKEKAEILRNGAESAMKSLLPIVDDFERGLAAIKDSADADAVKEGMTLIYNKFVKYLEQNGVKAMDSTGAEFNDELHEAVALVPGPEEHKGKVIDTVQKGYMINDKVLRHAKVAVGQ